MPREFEMTSWQFTPVVIFYIIAAWTAFVLAYTTWKMRAAKSVIYFSAMSFSAGIWALGYLLGFFNADLAVKLVMLRFEYLGNILATCFWLLFAVHYTKYDRQLKPLAWIMLAIIPVLTILQILYVDQHTFFYESYQLSTMGAIIVFEKVYGPGFYLWAAFAYIATLIGGVLLMRSIIFVPGRLRKQSYAILLVVLIILVPNALYLTARNPIAPYDPTSITFVLIGFIFLASLRWIRFLDVVPIAHDLVLDNIASGVIILDNFLHVMEMNPAAERILNHSEDSVINRPFNSLFPSHQHLAEHIQGEEEFKTEIVIEQTGTYEFRAFPIINTTNEIQGRVIMLYDITAWKLAELELRKQAITDPLTGLYNRRHFFTLAGASLQQARRYHNPLSILMIDLDHFKNVNDTYGHAAGDQVLQAFASHLLKTMRTADICGRYGGEEFVILMPETSCGSAALSANRLREWISEQPIIVDHHHIYLTVSVGVAELDMALDHQVDTLINRADEALYNAKRQGRNVVTCAREL
jgi:diguanylate cyclase (GGDEF)-like protein